MRGFIRPDAPARRVTRPHGSTTFRLTQFFMGLSSFFHRIGRAPGSGCSHDAVHSEKNEADDDGRYTLKTCKTFDGKWEGLAQRIGLFEPDDSVSHMLEFPDFAEAVLTDKESAERQRQSLDVTGVHPQEHHHRR